MAFLVCFYFFCLISGGIARAVAFRGEKEYEKINSLLNLIGRSWSACILAQSWRAFFATEILFVGAASLLLGSGRFGATFANFDTWMFFSGFFMLFAAFVAQRFASRVYKEYL